MSIEDEAKEILLKLGLYWPDGDADSLRDAATAWRTFADAVDDVRAPVHKSASSLIHHNKGESIEAFEKFWGRYAKGQDGGWLSDLADAARGMAKALDKMAHAIDDAINKLWTQITIDAVVIAAGIGLAVVTAGIASGAAAAATEVIIELGATMGVAVSTTVAEIAAGTLIAAAFGGVESVTVDAAVAQPLKMITGLQKGFSLDEVNKAATDGMLYGGALGAGSGVLKAGMEGAFSSTTPLMLRPPSLRPDLVELGPAARKAERTPCVGEPIDVATGAMLMTQTDLSLPASLPLLFQRTHLSSSRGGVCFGPTWISTLDECVQIDGEGVVFAAADGMRLVYPIPEPGLPALPVKGARWPLEWDGKPDGVMTITDPDTGVTRSFSTPLPSGSFGVFHLPVDAWSDRNGARIDVERDDDGLPVGLRHSGGYYVAVDTAGPRITALRLLDRAPDAYAADASREGGTTVMRYGYDEAGNLTEVINSSDLPLRFAYDDQGRITKWTDRNGTWFAYEYDSRGRVVRTEGIDGILSGTLTYDDQSRTTTYTDSLGHTSTHRYNAQGLVEEETDQLGHITRTGWDERGDKPLAVTDPLGRTTRYGYDSAGNLAELTLPDGSVATARYDEHGLPLRIVEPGGATWLHTYDARGNLLTTTDPLGAVTLRDYDISGHLSAVTDALGGRRTVAMDRAGLPHAIVDEMGHATYVRRDSFGRAVEITDPLDRVVRFGWTVEGRPDWREHADGARETWTWDGEGNLLTHTDQAGHITRHMPAPFDVPAIRNDPDGATYAFTYDTELRLTGVTNPQGLTWTYCYDAAGRPIAETDFDGRCLRYEYNAVGELIARTNGADETLRFTRDVLGRITQQRDDSGATATFAYGASGHLVRAVNEATEMLIDRDAMGRVLSETVAGRTTAYTYDVLGRRRGRVTPSGLTSEWTYDESNRPAQLLSTAGSLTFSYDSAGRETRRRIGDHVTLDQTWGATDRLAEQTLSASSGQADRLLQHRTYAYRADGYVTEIRELSTGTRHFDLDAAGRVTGVRAHGWTEAYAYDVAGNQSAAAAPAHEASGAREFDGTLIRRAGRTTYEHDGQGRVVRRTRNLLNGQRRTWTFAWNAEDRLTEAVTPEGDRWQYNYDPLGRRISKSRVTGSDGVALDHGLAERTTFTWDDTRLAEQVDGDARVTTWEYEPGTHRPLTQTDHAGRDPHAPTSYLARLADETAPDCHTGTQFHAVVTDVAGTPTELITLRGEVSWQRRTTLWGTPFPSGTGETESVTCPLRFPGQYADAETGLCYNFFRYYDGEIARYVSADPLGLGAAPNPAAYVAAPLTNADPWGLYDCTKVTKVIDQSIERASSGRRRTASGYHGHLDPERELEILKNPDGVYISSGGAERLIFHQGEDIVVMESKGGKAGNVITSYGPSGPKNESGAAAWGGAPTDPGPPVTREQIVNGGIPTPKGGTLPPATQLR